jgi:hypothetical protein
LRSVFVFLFCFGVIVYLWENICSVVIKIVKNVFLTWHKKHNLNSDSKLEL